MSYQSYLQSIASSSQKASSPASSISRKPANISHPSGTYTPPSNSSPNPENITPSSRTAAQTTKSTATSPLIPQSNQLPNNGRLTPITPEQIRAALKACLDLQIAGMNEHGKRPFAGLLLAPDNTTIALTHFSISHFQHAETELARLAATNFSKAYLASCTLVSTWEPCAMCSGTFYWSNIGRLVYAASEVKLKELTGPNNSENLTLSLPCRDVLKHGQRDVEIIGPVPEWEAKVVEVSGKWWKDHQTKIDVPVVRQNGLAMHGPSSSISATTWAGEENIASTIGDDGEYKADLQIDWMN